MEMRDIDDWWDGPGVYWLSDGQTMRDLGYCGHLLRLAEAVCAERDRGVCIDDAIIWRSRVWTVQES
jgi:hypothetical protein